MFRFIYVHDTELRERERTTQFAPGQQPRWISIPRDALALHTVSDEIFMHQSTARRILHRRGNGEVALVLHMTVTGLYTVDTTVPSPAVELPASRVEPLWCVCAVHRLSATSLVTSRVWAVCVRAGCAVRGRDAVCATSHRLLSIPHTVAAPHGSFSHRASPPPREWRARRGSRHPRAPPPSSTLSSTPTFLSSPTPRSSRSSSTTSIRWGELPARAPRSRVEERAGGVNVLVEVGEAVVAVL